MTTHGKHLWDASSAPAPTPLDYALNYARLGWAVLPVWSVDSHGRCRCGRPNDDKGHKAGKHPQHQLAPHGHHDATTDEEQIRSWWATDPDAGVGVSLAASGLLALDIDPKNGGWESLHALEAEHGVLHSDCVAVTQGGGQHRLFTADPGLTFPGKLGAGLDLKHQGYVCVAPTCGPFGEYRWAEGRSPLSRSRPAAPSPLPELIAQRGRRAVQYALTERAGVPVATAQTFDDLRRALHHVDADDYEQWVNVGLALRPYGENGYRVWTEWSARSDKFDAAAQRRKWERDLDSPRAITYRSIFRAAQDAGWENRPSATPPPGSGPAAPEASPDDGTPHPFSLAQAVDCGATEVRVFEYLLDDFMSTGVNVVAGAPGVGKTTLVIPLALATAHLCPPEYALRPAVRRNVIIITESVVQVQRTVYSVYAYGGSGLRAEDFESRVRVLHARRLDPAVVCRVAEEYRGWVADNPRVDGTLYPALPLVVFDTANAVFELENENDNAEVGRALALVKQAFADFPVIIISHAAKINGTAETEQLGPRGASAWTGDAQGVYTVFKDGEHPESPRVMKAQKVRFPAAYSELAFDHLTHSEVHPDVLGHPRPVWFSHSVARPLRTGERQQVKLDAQEQRLLDEWVRLCDEMVELVRRDPGRSRTHYERLTAAQGGARGSQDRKERAVDSLLNDGSLERVELEVPRGRANHYLRVNEEVAAAHSASRYAV